MAKLNIPEYIVELWSSTDAYIADISEIISSSLRIELSLNNVETLDFTIDLAQFEKKCARIGADPRNILDPYRTDVKIRRNGKYLLGTQVVQVQGNFNNNSPSSIEVRCTGYLNLFKDRYVTASYSALTYAQISRQLIVDTQDQANGNFGVSPDLDFASSSQSPSRIRNYDLQNVKDGIINLTKLENDKFDFEFTHDKKYNVYSRLGSDKFGVELVYPQNIYSMSIIRDASTLANKIYGLGSGIGDEKITSTVVDSISSTIYKVRERTELFNSVINQTVLDENTEGALVNFKDIYEIPSLSLTSELLDLDELGIGDAVPVRVDGSTLFSNIDGMYRIIGLSITVDINVQENISSKLMKWGT